MRWSKGAQAEGPRSRPHGVLRAREARRPASSRAAVAPSLHRATMLRDLDPQHRTLDRALAGRYVLERRLGRGGMGVVFLARAAPRAPGRHQAAAPSEGRRPPRAPALSG